jgi:outer membrane cobalamin receptor
LGLEQKLPWNSLAGITGFYTDAKNFIEKNDFTNLYENYENDRFTGLEASLETRFLKNLMLRGTYTYLDAEDRSNSGRDVLQYRPQDKLTFEGRYDFDFGLSPYVSVLYVANQYFYSKTNAGTLMKGKLNNYSIVNAKVNQRLANTGINLYVGADNIFDTDYETSYGFPQAGRFLYGGISFSM